jgi:hypothetical protein
MLAAGDTPAACTALRTYITDVQGLPGAGLAAAERAILVQFGTNVRAVMGCA